MIIEVEYEEEKYHVACGSSNSFHAAFRMFRQQGSGDG